MRWVLPYTLPLLFLAVLAAPIEEGTTEEEHVTSNTEAPEINDLHKQLNVVIHIQNFKNIMTNYVKTQHKDLTFKEVDEVKTSIEGFLQNFARDLKNIMENTEPRDAYAERFDDGLPDSTFNDVRESVLNEFPHISESKANRIVLSLRRNLLQTRQQLDQILSASERAAIANS